MRARKWHNEESADLELVNLQSGSTDLSASYRVSTATKHTYLWRGDISFICYKCNEASKSQLI